MNPNAYNIYKNNSVNYASKEQLLLMLLDGDVKFAKIARQAIIDKNIEKAHNSLIRTQDIFTELMVSLDTTQGGWTTDLLSIYKFVNSRLAEANFKKSVEIMDEILPLIEQIKDMWNEVYKKAKR